MVLTAEERATHVETRASVCSPCTILWNFIYLIKAKNPVYDYRVML